MLGLKHTVVPSRMYNTTGNAAVGMPNATCPSSAKRHSPLSAKGDRNVPGYAQVGGAVEIYLCCTASGKGHDQGHLGALHPTYS